MSKKERVLVITQTRSTTRGPKRHQLTLQALGLGKIGRSVEHKAQPSIMGMIRSVSHLVEVREAVG